MPVVNTTQDMDLRSIDDRSTAQVVSIGEGEFGVIWNGELRPEKYPTKGIAYLAITALRRHESPRPLRWMRHSKATSFLS
jgi:hypothetical protein